MELHLILKFKWFDLIESGIKTEEYRDMSDYYCRKFYCRKFGFPTTYYFFNNYREVVFHRGYSQRICKFEIKSFGVGIGKAEWGAPLNQQVFIIKLGKRLPS